MSRYHDAFEDLAERGHPVGSEALTGELFVEGQSGELAPVQTPRRFGPLVAAAAAAAVIVGGFVLLPGNGAGEVAAPESIEWIEIAARDGAGEVAAPESIEWIEIAARDVVSGPGGFVLTPLEHDELIFSPDGIFFRPLGFTGSVAATQNRWLVVGFQPDEGSWTSTDGVNWSQIDAPPTADDFRTGLVAGGGGFLIEDWPETTMWWSEDGSQWTETDPIRSEVGEPLTVVGGDPGFIAFDTNGDRREDGLHGLLMSSDGVIWSQVDIAVGATNLVLDAAYAAERWWILAVDPSPTPDTIWSSDDGVSWDQVELPWPTHEIGPTRLVSTEHSLLVVLGDLPEGRSEGVWATTDGISWAEVLTPDTYPGGVAVSRDGSIGLWASLLEVLEGESVEQVETTESERESADPALISDGLSAQFDLLPNGFVTYDALDFVAAEFEQCLDAYSVPFDQMSLSGAGLIVVGLDGLDPETADLANACADAYANRFSEFAPEQGPVLIPAGLDLQYQIIEDRYVTFSELTGLARALDRCFQDLKVAASARFGGGEITVDRARFDPDEEVDYETCERSYLWLVSGSGPPIPDDELPEMLVLPEIAPSQSPADAVRDGVIPEVAELSLRDRAAVQVFVQTEQGIWAISHATPELLDTAPRCEGPDDFEGTYGVDAFCTDSYGEVLFLDDDLNVVRAYPVYSGKPRWLYVDSEVVYAGQIGDGGLPWSIVVRVDLLTLESTTIIFVHPEDHYSGLPGWIVVEGNPRAEGFGLYEAEGEVGPDTALSAGGGTQSIDFAALEALFTSLEG